MAVWAPDIPNIPIWVVWGPTAEWGEGSGPLDWCESQEDAQECINWHTDNLRDWRDDDPEGRVPWPYDSVGYWIEGPLPVSYFDVDPSHTETFDDLMEYLNGS